MIKCKVMRVICIEQAKYSWRFDGSPVEPRLLEIGMTYTVVQEIQGFGEVYYELEEVPPCPRPQCFASVMFIPCSDIDETELVNYEPAHA
jgi:hypothetical protein